MLSAFKHLEKKETRQSLKDTMMVIRVVLLLAVTTLVTGARKDKVVSVKLDSLSGCKGKSIRVILDSTEPQINSKPTRIIANTSVSPWTYRSVVFKFLSPDTIGQAKWFCYFCRESLVPSRIPQVISEAECLTSACTGLRGGAEGAGLMAAPIRYQILVLHRVPKKSQRGKGKRKQQSYKLRLGVKAITVGCTCVRPTIVSQN
ncbi:interleukin 17a/f3 isoform 1-T1 [Synchiropus picturatus]